MSQVLPSAFGSAVSGVAAGAPLGPVGMAVGGGVGLLSGIFTGMQANKLDREYKKAESALEPNSPDQIAYLNSIRQQERNFRTGTDPSSGFAMQNLRNAQSQTQANLMRAGGPGVVNNLLRSQAVTNQGFANVGANAAAQANQLLQFQGGLIDNIQNRKYQRQREIRNQAMERAASARQNIQNTFQGALAMVPNMTGQMGAPKMGGVTGRVFDPLSATSPGVGTFYPGAYDAGDMQPPTFMQPRPLGTPLSYQPLG